MSYSPRATRRGFDPLCGPLTEATRRRLAESSGSPSRLTGEFDPGCRLAPPGGSLARGSTTPGHSPTRIAEIYGECQTPEGRGMASAPLLSPLRRRDVLIAVEEVLRVDLPLQGGQPGVFLGTVGRPHPIGVIANAEVVHVNAAGVGLHGVPQLARPGDVRLGLSWIGPHGDDREVVIGITMVEGGLIF